MTKEEIQKKRVLQNGKPLALDKFSWNEDTRTFSTNESYLVLDFSGVNNITFKTGEYCTFKTESSCTFDTGSDCTFDTGSDCTFDTGLNCTFDIIVNGYFINKSPNNIVVVRNYDNNYKLYELNKLPKGLLKLGVDEVIEKEKENE